MAEEKIRLDVRSRGAEETGTTAVRALRRGGEIPGVIYGRGSDPVAIAIPEREMRRVLTGGHGMHAILDVVIDGQGTPRPTIVKDFQRHVIRGTMTHVDLQEVRLDQAITATVLVDAEGDSPGVREGGVLTIVARDLQVEALPLEVPERVVVDVSDLPLGGSVRLGELPAIPGVTFLGDPETILVTVLASRGARRDDEEGEETEGGEGPAAVAEEAGEADSGSAADAE